MTYFSGVLDHRRKYLWVYNLCKLRSPNLHYRCISHECTNWPIYFTFDLLFKVTGVEMHKPTILGQAYWNKSQLLHTETCNLVCADLLMNPDGIPKTGSAWPTLLEKITQKWALISIFKPVEPRSPSVACLCKCSTFITVMSCVLFWGIYSWYWLMQF